MNKKLSLALVVMLVLSIATWVCADVVFTRGPDSRVSTYVSSATSAGAVSSTVTTNNRVLGFTYSDSLPSSVSIYDGSAFSDTSAGNLIAKLFVAAGGSNSIMLPLPRNLTKGLITVMSTATGAVEVYYE